MSKKKKILVNGVSYKRGGFVTTPWDHLLDAQGISYVRQVPLKNEKLSNTEYFQFESWLRYGYGQNPENFPPSKFIIHDLDINIITCVKCLDTESHFLEPCKNCESNQILISNSGDFNNKAYCSNCKTIYHKLRWICKKCGCDNPLFGAKISHWVEIETLKGPQSNSNQCFIATACYEDCNSPEVIVLRKYRDEILSNTESGRKFIYIYYIISPKVAGIIRKSKFLRNMIKHFILNPIISRIENRLISTKPFR